MTIGIPFNPRSPALARRLASRAAELGVPHRVIDLVTLRHDGNEAADATGPVCVTHLAPGTTYGEPDAESALAAMERRGTLALNPACGRAIADDKILSARAFDAVGLSQPSWCHAAAHDLDAFAALGFPLVLKRPWGSLGMWNRLVRDRRELADAAQTLISEGGTVLLAQRAIEESFGRSLRVTVLAERVLTADEFVAKDGEWRSNGALGASAALAVLSTDEHDLALSATRAAGLGYAGVDLLRTNSGPVVIEINAGSAFNAAERRSGTDVAAAVLHATLAVSLTAR